MFWFSLHRFEVFPKSSVTPNIPTTAKLWTTIGSSSNFPLLWSWTMTSNQHACHLLTTFQWLPLKNNVTPVVGELSNLEVDPFQPIWGTSKFLPLPTPNVTMPMEEASPIPWFVLDILEKVAKTLAKATLADLLFVTRMAMLSLLELSVGDLDVLMPTILVSMLELHWLLTGSKPIW